MMPTFSLFEIAELAQPDYCIAFDWSLFQRTMVSVNLLRGAKPLIQLEFRCLSCFPHASERLLYLSQSPFQFYSFASPPSSSYLYLGDAWYHRLQGIFLPLLSWQHPQRRPIIRPAIVETW